MKEAFYDAINHITPTVDGITQEDIQKSNKYIKTVLT